MNLSTHDAEQCIKSLKEGSKSFYAASRLLPRRMRLPTAAVYAFCRATDDLVDETPDEANAPTNNAQKENGSQMEGAKKTLHTHSERGNRDNDNKKTNGPAVYEKTIIDKLKTRLENIYAKRNLNNFVDRAFAWVVEEYSIPKAVPALLLEGYTWDLENREYDTISSVRAYSARVAATVGVMMTVLMECRDRNTLARACDLGVAMQLTNIARDVGEDARVNRLYLPLEWLEEEGIDARQWIKKPLFNENLGNVIERLLIEAHRLYSQADAGIFTLPKDSRTAIWAARLIYSDIGRVIRKNRLDSVNRRAFTTKTRKARLLFRAFLKAKTKRSAHEEDLKAPPLEETRQLVESIAK